MTDNATRTATADADEQSVSAGAPPAEPTTAAPEAEEESAGRISASGHAQKTMDGVEAVARVAHKFSEVIAIYPITPSSGMGEWSEEWSSKGHVNLWGTVPSVTEMQSEAGAAGAVHGALQAGALTTTFTASQGLLLMIPNMYKIAGELTPFCMHVTARTLATHALSIFGDHGDVMAVRQTGFALLCAGSVQESQDLAAVAWRATLKSRVPMLHFFDGFRTSHEVAKIDLLTDDDLRAMVPDELVATHRARALTPDHPVVRGTAQNPDVFFQAREACNLFYQATPGHVQDAMDLLAERTGRAYHLFDYVGDPLAERVLVLMGSGAEVADEAVAWLRQSGERVGVVKVRLYRPFDIQAFAASLPATTKKIAVLDRTKEPGAVGEPLYQDVVTALRELDKDIPVIGGRYGLSSKEFTPSMVAAVFAELRQSRPKRHFTIGIIDDVSGLSLPWDRHLDIEPTDVVRACFYGLGADGTVGANKNSIKIIGEETDLYAQGYFVYDSKKSGSMTVSHLRFGPRPIQSSYLISQANFVACHQFAFVNKIEMLSIAAPGATVLLNAPYGPSEIWPHLPAEMQQQIHQNRLKLYVIDASKVARDTGMGGRINTIMQTCFFALSGVLPKDEAIAHIKHSIEKTYSKKGPQVIAKNFAAVDHTLNHLYPVDIPTFVTGKPLPPMVAEDAPDFVQRVTSVMLAGHGDLLPVSAFPVDGTWPVGTAKWEKRAIADTIPIWQPELCIQCNKCTLICPHAAIRVKHYSPEGLQDAPDGFRSMPFKSPEIKDHLYTIQVAPEDCTGCHLCVEMCPAKSKSEEGVKALNMKSFVDNRQVEKAAFQHFLQLPEVDRSSVKMDVKGSQFLEPLFEYSGACSGCGETPYVKLLTQLYGDRALIANATGCSSIFGGNLPTTPYTCDLHGRGPAWANSLFEDNAEFGYGMRLAIDKLRDHARELLPIVGIGDELTREILQADQAGEAGLAAQRLRVEALRERLQGNDSAPARRLLDLADFLVKKSVWIVGGDGWAYDIGFGGLDHVIAMNRNVNILVMDTEVYSNTGGQASKATPMGAAARFATAGKSLPKKDLAMLAMTYGHAYVAQVAMGAKDAQTIKAFEEADSYEGTSVIIAYSHCIAHGYDLGQALQQQEKAVQSAYWPLFRFDPRRIEQGQSPLKMDSNPPKLALESFLQQENRFRQVQAAHPKEYAAMVTASEAWTAKRFALYEYLAKAMTPGNKG